MTTLEKDSGIPPDAYPVRTLSLNVLGVICLVAIGYFVFSSRIGTIVGFGASMVAMLTLFTLLWPEITTLSIIFVLYTNFPVLASQFYGVPEPVAASFLLLLGLPMAIYILIRRESLRVDFPLGLMLVFLAELIASTFLAKDRSISMLWIAEYSCEGLGLYLLVINVVRNLRTLRRVVWVLIFAGSLLGGLSLFQQLTHSYDTQFGGLSQRTLKRETDDQLSNDDSSEVHRSDRADGPIGGPDRYAQIMVVLLPLALFRFWGEHSRSLRICAAAGAFLILCGVLLSYSRGAFLTLVLLFFILTYLGYVRPFQVLTSGLLFLLMVLMLAPAYLERMKTIQAVQGVASDEASEEPDASARGRLTEMLAAFTVFLDYPVLGVGPGQYTPFYSMEYQLNPDIAFRELPRNRRAHILYLGMAAETGVIGLTTFLGIVFVIIYRLCVARQHWAQSRPDLANMATGFCLSIIAYLACAVFLHLSYQRYYWLLLALAGAALQILYIEKQEEQVINAGLDDDGLMSNRYRC